MRVRKQQLAAMLSLCTAIAFTVIGTRRPLPAALEQDRARIVMAGIRDLGWNRIRDGLEQGRMPNLAAIASGDSAWGDIITDHGTTDTGILGSVLTGAWSERHGITSRIGAEDFDGKTYNRIAFWDVLSWNGHNVTAVGFPLWYPLPRTGSLVVPDWNMLNVQFHAYREGHRVSAVNGSMTSVISPDSVRSDYTSLVSDKLTLDSDIEETLRKALACDLTMLKIAQSSYSGTDDSHLFVYFEGLSIWLAFLESLPSESISAEEKEQLIDGYYAWIDLLIGKLVAHDDGRTAFVLFSENGNHGEPVTYRPYFPEPAEWPSFGVLMAWGYPIQKGRLPEIAVAADLAPTLLYIAGVPIPHYVDGLVLEGMINEEFMQRHYAIFGF